MFTMFRIFISEMENTEQTTDKVQIAARIDASLFTVIDKFRADEDRNMSNMIERLLKTHPRVQEILESQPATAGA